MLYIITAVLLLTADIVTKIIAKTYLEGIVTIPVIKNVFHFTYVENRGMAFGMFSGGRIGFIIITILIIGILTYILIKTAKEKRTFWLRSGTTLLISGAVGNLIERITRGYVVDFLDFRIINFPVFNVADIAVCVGAAMLVIHFMKTEN